MEHDVLIYTLLYKQNQYQRDKNTQKISCGHLSCRAKVSQQVLFLSSESGPYSAIDPYVKPGFSPDPPEMTALTPFHRVSRLYEFLSYFYSATNMNCAITCTKKTTN
jgi:hypothetical protein